MKIKNSSFKDIFIFSLIFFILFSSTYIAINCSARSIENKAKLIATIESEANLVMLEKNLIQKEFKRLIADIFLAKEVVENTINSTDSSEVINDKIIKSFESIVRNKKIYDQLRYLDQNGQEQIRIDFENNDTIIYDKHSMQNKKDRYYFTDTMSTDYESVYISKIDLNMENGRIEYPIKPVIRIATKVKDKEGNDRGIVISNYFASSMFADFEYIANESKGKVYLLNDNSYWLSNSENRHFEFAFMYPETQYLNFMNKFPNIWEKIKNVEQAYIKTDTDIFFSEEVAAFSDENTTDHYSLDTSKINLGEGHLRVVTHIDKVTDPELFENSKFISAMRIIQNKIHVLLLLLLLSIILAYTLHMYLSQKEETKFLSEHDPMTGTYNRRAGIAKSKEIIRKTRMTKDCVSFIFIDVNGLKSVNDILGHKYGDVLIKSVAKIIKSCIRENDILFRYGGDEFVICVEKMDEATSEELWERILEKLKYENSNEKHPFNMSLSHGICTIDQNQEDVDIQKFIDAADKKMYSEKLEIKKTVQIIK